MKKISQRKIAEDLGVSQSLVSLALNGKREEVSESTYERIWQYAQEHGYRGTGGVLPGNTSQRMMSVGLILREPLRLIDTSNFFGAVHHGIHSFLVKHGVHATFLGGESQVNLERFAGAVRDDSSYRGTVVLGEAGRDFMAALARIRKPLVAVSARFPGMCHSVNANEFEAALKAVEYLRKAGARRFVFLCGERPVLRNRERLEAFQEACRIYGIAEKDQRVESGGESQRQDGRNLAKLILAEKNAAFWDGWICSGGLIARGVIDVLGPGHDWNAGHLKLVTMDESPACSAESPQITSTGVDPELIGSEAVRLLLQESGGGLMDLVLSPQLRRRETA